MKKKRDLMHQITGLQKPMLKDGRFTEDPDPKKCLIPREEFSAWYKLNGNKYMWDNYNEDLAQTKTGKGERVYKGMRLRKRMKTWEALGQI